MSRRRGTFVGRDQAASAFSAALMRLCEGTGVAGAALVDAQGETVDYAGGLDPFDIKVAAAEWQLVVGVLRESRVPAWRETHELVVRARFRSYSIVPLSEGYAIVATLTRYCFEVPERALAEAVRELCRESGLSPPPFLAGTRERWTRVEVQTSPHDARRAEALWHGGAWRSLEILGRYTDADLGSHEVGYRARLSTGAELTLVRERLGIWYADDTPSG
jgi:hypothetical protein